jgi:serine/threonine-protein kinase
MKVCPQCAMRYPDDVTVCFIDATTLVDPFVGTVFEGRYRIGESIGQTWASTIYRATRVSDGRACAIKLGHGPAGRALRERFEKCTAASRKIRSPYVVEIIEHGSSGEDPYLVMELLAGTKLSTRLEEGALPMPSARELMIHLARGVACAHDAGEVHGALQPACVFLARDGEHEVAKIFDFGAARVRREGPMHAVEMAGIVEGLAYVAPERGERGEAGTKGDLYALGAIFYRMVAGRPPFDPMTEQYRAPTSIKLLRPLVPAALDTLIMSLLATAPSERPADAHAVESALATVAS